MKLEDHPTVKWHRSQVSTAEARTKPAVLDTDYLKELCLKSGADDAGFVDICRPALVEQMPDIEYALPGTKTVVALAFRLHRENIRTMAHSVTNLEFQQTWSHAKHVGRVICKALGSRGVGALNVPAGFPYESDRWPGKMWLTSDKIIAEEASLGRMGLNRLVLHPRFGSFMILGTILLDTEVSRYDEPIEFNPCVQCKLCASVCPVGAIAPDGHFDFFSCYTHNYRERLSGFSDWIETVASAGSRKQYRSKVTDSETVSMWQNLAIGAQTKCDRCVAVCPAGEQGIGEFLEDRKAYVERLLKPFRDRSEVIYAVPGSDAEAHVAAHFPNKTVKRISNGLRPNSVQGFLQSLPLVFQRYRSEGLNATFHFTFTGEESCKGTAVIRDKTLQVHDNHVGESDLHLIADSRTWLRFLAKEKSMLSAIVTGKIRIKGSPRLMKAFARCFPS
ncbi:MAG: SCP2 sterol-binding domain-containing protein [Desulfomonile tiedjei]|uniref:SCP2 sterol-binding domain-containing protein n=1 Tax=Desulfomonile tiedjei TaxID=2358 RepID=A0A9D6Z4P3_9BACT|nr:SCP2 sterol-binding domain-containing protein [Desulfomonile tiedjei]